MHKYVDQNTIGKNKRNATIAISITSNYCASCLFPRTIIHSQNVAKILQFFIVFSIYANIMPFLNDTFIWHSLCQRRGKWGIRCTFNSFGCSFTTICIDLTWGYCVLYHRMPASWCFNKTIRSNNCFKLINSNNPILLITLANMIKFIN